MVLPKDNGFVIYLMVLNTRVSTKALFLFCLYQGLHNTYFKSNIPVFFETIFSYPFLLLHSFSLHNIAFLLFQKNFAE